LLQLHPFETSLIPGKSFHWINCSLFGFILVSVLFFFSFTKKMPLQQPVVVVPTIQTTAEPDVMDDEHTEIPTISVEGIIQPSTRKRAFSFSNLVQRTRRAYSVSSAYPPKSHPALALPVPKSSNDLLDGFDPTKMKVPSLTPAQRRNSIAAAQRKYEDFEQKIEAAPLFVLVSTYLNYFVLILFGHVRDIMGKLFKRKEYAHLRTNEVSFKVA
jgi:hypothetical protein